MAGFLTNLGISYGNSLIYGQEYQKKQADLDLEKQQIQMGQIALGQAQQRQQTQQAVGQFLASEAAKDQSNVTDPVKVSQQYEKAAGIALQNGDFASANTMNDLAKGKLAEAKEQSAALAQQQQVKKEALSNAADDYASAPSSGAASDLMRKAVDAGVNPTTIPQPGTPQFASWANQQALASKTASQKADFLQKAYEMNANRQEKQQEHADNVALRTATIRQTAAYQNGMLDLRRAEMADKQDRAPQTKDIGGSTYEYDPAGRIKGARDTPDPGWVKVGGPKQTAQMQQTNNAIVASASEGLRGLKNIGAMSSDATAGPFAGLHDGTILDSIAKTGTQAMTPTDMQIYHVAAAGMGLEVSRTLTLGGGRGANQALINEMQNIVEVHPGESKATALFKYSNAADIIRNRLSTLPDTSDPKVMAQRKELESDLEKIPTPQQVLSAVGSPKERQKLLGIQSNMAELAGKVADSSGESLPGGADTGAGTNVPPLPSGGGLPSGWSVEVH